MVEYYDIGMNCLSQVARKLHHYRELSERGRVNFLTWFEFSPEHEAAFDLMLEELRRSPEWNFVDWEIDIRLRRA